MPLSARVRSSASRGALVLLIGLALLPLEAEPAPALSSSGQFVLRCEYSHTLMDDPIVAPGQPGASHSHDFFGNKTANAFSTVASMLKGSTTCRVPSDTAGYWAPTAYLGSQQIRPTVMRIYYLGTAGEDVETIPPGLQMIGGNKLAASPQENPHVRWSCGETKNVRSPRSSSPYDCTWWNDNYHFVDGVIAIVDFPSCWDGVGLRPENVVYRTAEGCPDGFDHVLPRISERIHYGIMNPLNPDGTMALSLSSGPTWTYHADFWNTWQQERLDEFVSECIVASVHCGSVDATERVAWTEQFGTSRYDLAYAAGVADNGDVYVAGFTNFALPGQSYRHKSDAFVRKYDANGRERWTRQFGSSGTDQAMAIAVDATGVTVVGSTDGRMPNQESAGGLDAFAARFGPSGRQLWLRQFGTRSNDRANAVVATATGPIIAGTTEGALGERRGGVSDAFVAQLDTSGQVSWLRQFGTPNADEALGVAARAGRVYVAGWTSGSFHGTFLGGESDGFVAAFEHDGSSLWRQQLGSIADDRVAGILVRSYGLFVAGSTSGALPAQTSAGGVDAFAGKIDLDGRLRWFEQFGSPADDEAVAVEADGGGVYVAGSALGALPDAALLGEWDGFVRKYLANGTLMWTRQVGTTDYDRVYGLGLDADGLVLAGTTHGAFEGFVNAGDRDVFVLRVAFA